MLRDIYRTAYATIEAARVANLKQLTEPLSLRLKTLETEFTKQKRVPDAKTVREYREALSQVNATTPGRGQNAESLPVKVEGSMGAGVPVSAPAPKYPPGDERKAAEWALNMGGHVTVAENSSPTVVMTLAALPRGKFTLLKVKLPSPNQPLDNLLPLAGLKDLISLDIAKAPDLQDNDMDVLTSLPALEFVGLTFGSLTDGVFTRLAKLRALKVLIVNGQPGITGSGLALISKLKVERLYLQGCQLSEDGFKNLGQLNQMTELSLQQANVRDEHLVLLDPLEKLESLDVGESKVTQRRG